MFDALKRHINVLIIFYKILNLCMVTNAIINFKVMRYIKTHCHNFTAPSANLLYYITIIVVYVYYNL